VSDVQIDDSDLVFPKAIAFDVISIPNECPANVRRNELVCGKPLSITEML
jgi:hypothetical protein